MRVLGVPLASIIDELRIHNPRPAPPLRLTPLCLLENWVDLASLVAHHKTLGSMRIYWSVLSIPGASELSFYERRQIGRQWFLRGLRKGPTWIVLTICCGCGPIGGLLGDSFGFHGIGVLVGGFIGGFLWQLISLQMMVPEVQAAIARRKFVPNQQPETAPQSGVAHP